MIPVFVPPALPSPLLHFPLEAPLFPTTLLTCAGFPVGIVYSLHPCYRHMHKGFFFSAGSTLPHNCCLGREMEIDAFAGWGMSRRGGGSSPAQ